MANIYTAQDGDTITVSGNTESGILSFPDVSSRGAFSFSRDGDGNLVVSAGGGSVTIAQDSYADGRYSITFGIDDQAAGSSVQSLGRLALVASNGTVPAGTDNSDVLVDLKLGNKRTLQGGDGDDAFYSGIANNPDTAGDTYQGGAGDDFFQANNREEVFSGGGGFDTLSYENSDSPIYITRKTGSTGSYEGALIFGKYVYSSEDEISGIERIIGSPFNDKMLDLQAGHTYEGGEGNDELRALAYARSVTIRGGAGDDTITGGDYGGTLDGGAGIDTITSGRGVDYITGGAGDDTINSGSGNDFITGGAGNDILNGGTGRDTYTFYHGGGDDKIVQESIAVGQSNVLRFKDVSDPEDFIFSIDQTGGENNGDVLITTRTTDASGNVDVSSVTIKAAVYANGRYTVQYGAGDTTLGKLRILDPDLTREEVREDALVVGTDEANNVIINSLSAFVLCYGGDDTVVVSTTRIPRDDDRIVVYGGDGNDVLTGAVSESLLYGGAGDDTLTATGGNQYFNTLVGGAGADTFVAGNGARDVVSYKDSPDSDGDGVGVTIYLLGVDEDGNAQKGIGDDAEGDVFSFLIDASSTGVDTLVGSNFADKLVGDLYGNILEGGRGDDILIGLTGNDTLRGGSGNDILEGGLHRDRFDGGEGIDEIVYKNSLEAVTVNLATGEFSGGEAAGDSLENVNAANIENIVGSAQGDTLTGNRVDNILKGGDGADTLEGGLGSDTLKGGVGADSYVFRSGDGADIIEGDADGGKLYFKDATEYDHLIVTKDGNDAIVTVGSDSVRIKDFAEGLYTMFYGDSDTQAGPLTFQARTEGTDGVDRLQGSDAAEDFEGFAGDDFIEGLGGNDTLDGGEGRDTLYGGEGYDTYIFRSGDGNDIISGDDGGKLLFKGATGADSFAFARVGDALTITLGSDSVTVEDFANGSYSLHYGTDDIALGRFWQVTTAGETTTAVEDGEPDWIVGSTGVDIILGHGGGDLIQGREGNDEIYGGGGWDTLYGGADNDKLYGERGVDTIYGGAGTDTLEGGVHDDILDGGAGADTYVFTSGDGADTIQGDENDATGTFNNLFFKDATGIDSFSFSRNSAGDVVITVGSDSVTILASSYADGRYAIFYGDSDTELGKFSLGTADRNILSGASGRDWLRGLGGDDDLSGGNDNDILQGNSDGDTLTGGAGDDILQGHSGSDILIGGTGDDILEGGDDADDVYIFQTGHGADTIQADSDGGKLYFKDATGRDSFAFSRTDNDVTITLDSDSVTIKDFVSGHYSLHHGNGNIQLGRLSLATTEGGEIAAADDGNIDWMVGSAGVDILRGGAGNDLLQGADNDDQLYGGGGNDVLEGGAGEDTFYGGTSSDTLVGGTGADTYVFDEGFYGGDAIRGDENDVAGTVNKLYFKNAAGIDSFSFSRENNGNVRITVGNDLTYLLSDSYANGRYSIHYGDANTALGRLAQAETAGGTLTAADDNAADFMAGGGGVDILQGLGGNDILDGDEGADTLEGGAGNDILLGGTGADTYVFRSGDGADTIRGDENDAEGVVNKLHFRDATGIDDFSFSRNGAGDVIITVGSDSATILDSSYANGRYSLHYGDGNTLLANLILGTTGDDTAIEGTGGGDLLLGLAGDDTIQGRGGNDQIYGGAGIDTLYGGAGTDTLEGGVHDDILDGGAGADTYVFTSGDGADTIQGETDDSELYFKDATGIGDFSFSRNDAGDVIIKVGEDSVTILEPSYANDRYTLFYGDSKTELIQLSFSTDSEAIVGTDNADLLVGLAGNDIIYGNGGNDEIYGGGGVDTLYGGEGNDELYGQEGNDILEGGAGADIYVFRSGDGADTIQGETDGGVLYFRDVTSIDTLQFSSDDSGGVKITAGSDSVNIIGAASAGASYNIHFGEDNTQLGRLDVGSAGDDTAIEGTEGGDLLLGLAGDDTIQGRGGNDQIYGGVGIDTLHGGDGDDNLYGGGYGDFLYGGADNDELYGDRGTDTLYGDEGTDTLTGGTSNDILDGGAGADTYVFRSGDGADTIQGDESDAIGAVNELHFRDATGIDSFSFSRNDAGDVIITVGSDSVTILASAYADSRYSLHYGEDNTDLGRLTQAGVAGATVTAADDDVADLMLGDEGGDAFFGRGGDDNLYGGRGIDTLDGGAGDDHLYGGGYADTLTGGAGADHLDGGNSPSDTASYEGSQGTDSTDVEGVVVDLAAGTGSGEDAEGDTLVGIENLVGSLRNDILTGGDEANKFEGKAGDDELHGGRGIDTLYGGVGNDKIYGDGYGDTLYGGVGNDELYGGRGLDTLEGGAGADTYVFRSGEGADTIRGDGNDATGIVNELHFRDATGGDFSFSRNDAGDVSVTVGDASVTILASSYADGRYSLHYGDGNTPLGQLTIGTAGDDAALTGSGGADLLAGLTGIDTLRGGAGNDRLYGGGYGDFLYGGADNDELYGDRGTDTLYGDEGTDTLTGGTSNDILDGGAGADTYVFRSGDGADTIQGDGNDAIGAVNELHFRDATGIESFSFSRNDAGDVIITVGSDSVTILASSYASGRYSLHYGDGNTDLGRLTQAGVAGATVTAADDDVADLMLGDEGGDTFVGRGGNDNLYGGRGIDTLDGGAGDDHLYGGGYADTLTGGAGADHLDGGNSPADTASYETSQDTDNTNVEGVVVNLATGTGSGEDAEGDTLVGIENLVGSVRNDVLTGGDEANKFEGKAGDDELHGGRGIDTLYGGAGNDEIYGDGYGDFLYGGADNDELYGGNGIDTLYGEAGTDTLTGGTSNDILEGGAGADIYVFRSGDGADTIRGDENDAAGAVNELHFRDATGGGDFSFSRNAAGDVIITVGEDSVTILASSYASGRYSLHYGDGNTDLGRLTLTGVAGATITAAGDDAADLMWGDDGEDTFVGRGGDDNLYGGRGIDTLDGGAGDDNLYGGGYADTLTGGAGADHLDGGNSPADTASYEGSQGAGSTDVEGIVVNLATGAGSGEDAEGDTLVGIENLVGSLRNDILTGDDEANRLEGKAGDDELHGGRGIDTLYGGVGNDEIYGDGYGDFLYGGAGDDELYGGRGLDTLDGGAGADTYVFRSGEGADTIRGDENDAEGVVNELHFRDATGGGDFSFSRNDAGGVVITVGDASVTILEASYADGRYSLHYGDSNTLLANLFLGTTGDDTALTGTDGADLLAGLAGADTISGGDNDDTLYGGVGIDTLDGGDGDDNLYGGGYADTLTGGAGADYLDGGNSPADTASYAESLDTDADKGVGVTGNLATGEAFGDDAEGDTLVGIENLIGSAFRDTLTGDDVANKLTGRAGADTLEGGRSNDILEGGTGADTYVFRSGDGADTIRGDENDATVTVNKLYFRDATGIDDFSFSRNNDAGDVVITIGEDSVTILASSYVDGRYSLHYSAGNTALGRLTQAGVAGATVTAADDGVTDLMLGDEGGDIFFGRGGDDHLYGGRGVDTLDGGAGDDNLYGGGYADTLTGGAGADYLDGGNSPADTASYEGSQSADDDGVVVNLATDASSGDDAEGDTLVGIENLIGSAFRDTLTGGDEANRFDGKAGDDELHGGRGIDTLYGGAGNDEIYGDGYGDFLYGGAGDDELYGGRGLDTLDGGAGADTYVFRSGEGADTIRGDENDAEGVVNELHFRDATGGGDFSFSRNDAGGVVITVGDASVTILEASYADGRYSLHYGDSNTLLANLFLGTTGDDTALTGTDGADLLAGLAGADTISGGDNADTLYGGVGIDTLRGGAGNDRLYGGGYGDFLYGGADNDELYGDRGTDTLYGEAGTDTLTGGTSNDILEGGAGADTYVFRSGEGADTIRGDENDATGAVNELHFRDATGFDSFSFSRNDAGDVIITVGDTSVTILASSYADGRYSLHYGGGNTALGRLTLTGVAGATVTAADDDVADLMLGDEGGDTFFGRGGDDNLYGGRGIDTLDGGAGDDNLYGGGYADTLTGGAGADHLDGGNSPSDTASYEGSQGTDNTDVEGVVVDLAAGTGSGEDAEGDTLVGIENLVGSLRNDILTGGDEANKFEGKAGDDELHGGRGIDTLYGGVGNDEIYGDGYGDTLYGGVGDDELYGGNGIDTLYGEAGTDTLTGGTSNDILEGGADADIYVFRSGDGADTIRGDENDATGIVNELHFRDATGGGDFSFSRNDAGDVSVTVGDASVTILASSYADGRYSLHYGDGNTPLGQLTIGTAGDDAALTGSGGADLLAGLTGIDTLRGGAGNDRLYGGGYGDFLYGGADNDELYGGRGTDTLYGDAGTDTLTGGTSNDILEGGAGADTYVFRSGEGADTIRGDENDATGAVNELHFRDATGFDSFSFSRNDAGDVIITVGDTSVTILASSYADGRYSLHYGGGNTALGSLTLGTTGNDAALTGSDDAADLLVGLVGEDTLDGGAGNDRLYGGGYVDTLIGGAGADYLDGGNSPADTASYEGSQGTDNTDVEGVVVDLAAGTGSGEDAEGDTLVGIENLVGSLRNDILTGDDEANRLEGKAGDDELHGGRGIDTLYGGVGDDELYGGNGIDTLYGEAGTDTLTGGTSNDILEGGAGADTYVFRSGEGADTIRGDENDAEGVVNELHFRDATGGDFSFSRNDAGDVSVTVGDASVTILASSYADGRYSLHYGDGNTPLGQLTIGTAGDDAALTGSDGADLLAGLAGADTIRGGDNADTLYGGVGIDTLYGEVGNDQIYGGGYGDFLYGGADNDGLYGGRGIDTLYGGAGTDTLEGGAHNDILEGGAGADIYVFRNGDGADTIQGETDGSALYFKDATGFDSFSFSRNNAGDVTITVGDASVTILASSYADGRYSLHYGDANTALGRLALAGVAGATLTAADDDVADLMRGDEGGDTFVGRGGDDNLYGGRGVDTLDGGDGDDHLYGGGYADTLIGGAGADHLDGGNSPADTASYEGSQSADDDGVVVNLVTDENSGDDAEGDTLVGIENLIGSAFGDTLTGGDEANRFDGKAGDDELHGGRGIDTLYGGAGNDEIYGDGYGDFLYGGADNDELYGDRGTDTLYGDEGTDTLTGGTSNDILDGGAGADTYVFRSGDGADTIQGDESDAIGAVNELHFRDATGIESFSFSRNDAGDVIITVGSDSVTILASSYASGRYSLHYGDGNTDLGRLTQAGVAGATVTAADDDVADLMLGDEGGDTFVGRGGDDNLYGGRGIDTLDGGDGDDHLYGGGYADTLTGGAGADYLDGGNSPSDTASYEGSQSADDDGVVVNLVTGEGSGDDAEGDTLVGIENLVGSAFGDTLTGGDEANRFDGKAGNDELHGGRGIDTLYGGAGNDKIYGDGYGDTLYGGADNDELYGGNGIDTLYGEAGTDTLTGGTSNDILEGGTGADTYVFGSGDGADRIRGDENDAEGVVNELHFRDATGFDSFSFLRNDAGDVSVKVGEDSVTILASSYANGRYSLHYGDGNTPLGQLTLGTTGDDAALIGTAGADLLLGLAGRDRLSGGDNDDTLYGNAGTDTLEGGAGSDNLDGGSGKDTASYKNSDKGVRVSLALKGEEQIDFDGTLVRLLANNNEAKGDILTNIEYLAGSEHSDLLVGDAEDNIIIGNSGVDHIYGGDGNDELYGGREDGTDKEGFLSAGDHLYGGAGNDLIDGGNQGGTITGGSGNDDLYRGDAYVFGDGYGDDTILERPGFGSSNLQFEESSVRTLDDFSFSRNDAGDVIIATEEGSVTILAAAYKHGSYTLFGTNLLIGGSRTADFYMATTAGGSITSGRGLPNVMIGLAGEDIFRGKQGNDRLYGRGGEDHLYGEAGSDHLYGGGDNDELYGGAGTDTLEGGAGADAYVFRSGGGADTVRGDENDAAGTVNKLYFRDAAGAGDFSFSRNDAGDVVIRVRDHSVKILESSYADGRYSLHYGGSDESLGRLTMATTEGGTLEAPLGGGKDLLVGLEGADTLRGFGGRDYLYGGADGDHLYGGGGGDVLYGGADDDMLYGAEGNDVLNGDAGVDTLYGGAGNDVLLGDEDADSYVFSVGDGTDLIYDDTGDSMTLRFVSNSHASYEAEDFTASSANFVRVGNGLVITVDKNANDGITDKIEISNAFDSDSSTGTGNLAFTINVQYGSGDSFTEIALDDAFWHTL